MFSTIPNEIILYIFEYIKNIKDYLSLMRVSKIFRCFAIDCLKKFISYCESKTCKGEIFYFFVFKSDQPTIPSTILEIFLDPEVKIYDQLMIISVFQSCDYDHKNPSYVKKAWEKWSNLISLEIITSIIDDKFLIICPINDNPFKFSLEFYTCCEDGKYQRYKQLTMYLNEKNGANVDLLNALRRTLYGDGTSHLRKLIFKDLVSRIMYEDMKKTFGWFIFTKKWQYNNAYLLFNKPIRITLQHVKYEFRLIKQLNGFQIVHKPVI